MVNVLCFAFLPYFKVLFGGLMVAVNSRNTALWWPDDGCKQPKHSCLVA
jgi:hypothetical protein